MYAFECKWPEKECVDFTDCQRCMEEIMGMYSNDLTESDVVGRHIERRWRSNVLKVADEELRPENRLYTYSEYYTLFTSQSPSGDISLDDNSTLSPHNTVSDDKSTGSQMVNPKDLMKGELLTPERRLVCKVGACNKSYSSIYGLKYHMKNGHRKPLDTTKKFVCTFPLCGKRYKNANGLKYHVKKVHLVVN